MTPRGALLWLLLGGSLAMHTGCLFPKKKPTPAPAPLPPPKPTRAPKPEPLPPPPKVEAQAPPLSTVPAPPEGIDTPEPPPQHPRRPRRPTATPPAQTAPEPPPQQPAPEPPKLVQLLTPDEQRRYQGELDAYLRSADAILASAAMRSLDTQQADLVVRIRAFAQQAREARDTDLMTARNLAQRADILARDLQRTLR